jgi:hypothetical protein
MSDVCTWDPTADPVPAGAGAGPTGGAHSPPPLAAAEGAAEGTAWGAANGTAWGAADDTADGLASASSVPTARALHSASAT